MNAWKAVFLVVWLVLPVSPASGQEETPVEVPKEVVNDLLELGNEIEVGAAGTAGDLEALSIQLNRGGEPELLVKGLGGEKCDEANCQTWVYHKAADGYRLLLAAGWVNRIEPQTSYTKGYRDLLVVIQESAWESTLFLYKFDGEYYHQSRCYLQTYRYEDRDGTLREWKTPKTTRIECDVDCC
jgi:hypothetical protein